MSRRNRLSRDQKRKQKLARRGKPQLIEPYQGSKYRSEEFVETLMQAELGIYEAYVMTERRLTDRNVSKSLEYLILQLRGQKPTAPANSPQVKVDNGESMDMVAWRIKENWRELYADRPPHSNADLAGVLRTILNSIQTWSRPVPDSRGYLHYVEGFLRKLGFSIEVHAGDEADEEEETVEESEADPDQPTDEEVLTHMGEDWIESGDPMAKKAFLAEAEALLAQGKAGVVIEVCQGLMGKSDKSVVAELQEIMRAAWQQEPPLPPPTQGFRNWLGRMAPRWLSRRAL